MKAIAFTVISGTLIAGCRAGSHAPATSAPHSEAAAVVSLAAGTAPLRDRFNAAAGQPRFIALLSPT